MNNVTYIIIDGITIMVNIIASFPDSCHDEQDSNILCCIDPKYYKLA